MNLKKLFLIICSLCLGLTLALGIAACGGDDAPKGIHVISVVLDKTELDLEEEEGYTLTATILPSNADDKTIVWQSSNEAVATVTGGTVLAVSAGTADITATVGGKTATCTVTVTEKVVVVVPVANISINRNSLSLEVGGTHDLVATVLPANATNRTVAWASDNACVTVSGNGKVTAVSEGTANITATADGKTATCKVTVTEKVEIVEVEAITLNETSVTLTAGDTKTLTPSVTPEDATDKTVIWKSSNDKVATVVNGKITAVAEGTATITATAGEKTAVCSVKVNKKIIAVTSVTMSKTSLPLTVDGTDVLKVTILPADATDKTVSWKSSNDAVVEVSNGVVRAKASGTATITATVGEISATCTVTVTGSSSGGGTENPPVVAVTNITLNKTDLELVIGETFTLTATIAPSNATDNEVVWSSSDNNTATVVDGLVTAKAVGTAVITAKIGNIKAECEIGVIEAGGGEPDNPPVNPPVTDPDSIITYARSAEESAAFEWNETDASKAKVEYKLSTASKYTAIDSELLRQISADTARADILGLKGGASYDFKITSSDNKVSYATNVSISSHDRSGYAHHNFTSGVGAYNDDGTLKSGAKIIYVTEENKNDIDGKGTSIAEYLSSSASKEKNAIVVRIIGTVGAATWKEGNVTYTKTSSNVDSDKNLKPEAIIGANGKALDKRNWTQAELISGGYNVLDKSKFSELDGLNSTIKWDSDKNEFDSCWNDCQVKNASNITIEGVGEDAEIFQFGFTFKSCNSIEVRNLRFYDYTEDACSFEGSENSKTLSGFKHKNFWIHHNTFDIGVNYWDVCKEQDKHDGDGSTDFKYLAYVTIAYNRYNGTHKTGLVGGGDSAHQACFTFHHNYYNGCDQRMPLGRQANMHMYNNYYSSSGLYSISLRAGAYAFIENCVFTYFKSTTKPVELVKGSNGVPSAKLINCELNGRSVTNGVSGVNNLVVDDRTQAVTGDNLYGLNCEQASGFYTVTNMLATNKVATEIPKIAGTMKRGSNIDLSGGTTPPVVDPTPDPDPDGNVSVDVADLVSDGTLSINGTAHELVANLTEDGALKISTTSAKVTARDQQFDSVKYTHRIVLKGKGNYISVTAAAACTVKVYVVNGSTSAGVREIGLYTKTDATGLIGTTMGLDAGEAQIVEFIVSAANTYYIESITNELSIYRIDIIYS